MIKRLKYKQIDFNRYTNCFEGSLQKNFYASKDNLDFLCEEWEILIYGDYEYIMPIPLKKKWGIKFVLMPLFCQQLGIFGKNDNVELNEKFLEFFKKNFNIYNYSFNEKNHFSERLMFKKNYIVPQNEYQLQRKKYFKGRKSTVKSAKNLEYRELQLNVEILDFIKRMGKGLHKEHDMQKQLDYIHFLEKHNHLKLSGSFLGDKLISLAVMIAQPQKYQLLSLVNDKEFKIENGASFLIDRILFENISEKPFDFMSGNIRNLEIFFKSFGAALSEFPAIQNSRIQLVKNLLIR